MDKKEAKKIIEKKVIEDGEVWYDAYFEEELGMSQEMFYEICDELGLEPLEDD